MNRFRFKSGVITERTAMALNDIAAWIEREERTRKGDSEFPTVERRRVKLTAHNGGTPPIYTGVEQSFTIAGVEEDKPNGESFSPTNQPIYERNGQTVSAAALTAGYHCWVDRRTLVDGTPTYEFDIGNPSTSGSFTLAGRTGTQTISSGDTMTLANGVVSATDTWTPDDASVTLKGMVNTTSQTFAGEKVFDNVTIGDRLLAGVTTEVSADAGGGHIDFVNSIGAGLGAYIYAIIAGFVNSQWWIGSSDLGAVHGGILFKTGLTDVRDFGMEFKTDSSTFKHLELGNPLPFGVTGIQAKYCVHDISSGTMRHGATGTTAGGDSVVGGIVYALGSALSSASISDFDEAAQDATGAMCTDGSIVYVDGTPLLTRGALTGDVTASQGDNATTIANNAVTFAKMQAVSANVLLGNDGSGTAVEEISLGTSLAIAASTLDVATVDGGTF